MAVSVNGKVISNRVSRRGTSMTAKLRQKGGQTRLARTLAQTRRALGQAGVDRQMKTFRVRAVKGRGGRTTYVGKNG